MSPPMMKMVKPSWMAVAQSIPVATFSHGTPIAKMLQRYEQVGSQVDAISNRLDSHTSKLMKDIGLLDRLFDKTLEILVGSDTGRQRKRGHRWLELSEPERAAVGNFDRATQ